MGYQCCFPWLFIPVAGGQRPVVGSWTVKVVPSLTWLITAISPPVVFNDPFTDRQAETVSGPFGGKTGLEDFGQDVVGHPRSIVFGRDEHVVVFNVVLCCCGDFPR